MSSSRVSLIAVIAAVVCLASSGMGKTIYVDSDAFGAGDGSSWADAYNHLPDALADANSADKPVDVLVAQGLYRPDESEAEPNGTGDQTLSFDMIAGVAVKGGYAGSGHTDPDARDTMLYKTVLSGDLAGDDVPILVGDDLSNEPSYIDNSYHVVTSMDVDSSAVIEGFTVTAGNADGLGTDEGEGGGMLINGGSVVVRDCIFRANRSGWVGGGVRCIGRGVQIIGCTLEANRGAHGGGVLFVYAGGNVLTDCTFVNNSAIYMGGAVALDTGVVELYDSTFIGNTAQSGGAIAIYPDHLAARVISGCVFIGNTATHDKVRRGGGAIMDWASRGTVVSQCVFQGNECPGKGGAIYCGGSDTRIVNCTFAGNRAALGQAIGAEGTEIWTGQTFDAAAVVNSCILWDAGQEIFIDVNASVEALYSNIRTESHTVWPGVDNINEDPFFAAPGSWKLFGGRSLNDPCEYWDPGDYHLKSERGRWNPADSNWVNDDVTSTGIDGGDPNLCIGFEPYPNGDRVNMGAYGSTQEASKSLSDIECFDPSHPEYAEWSALGKPICWCYRRQCHGDVDCESEGGGKVGVYNVHFRDLNLLLAAWNITEPPNGPGIASIEGPAGGGICADFAHDAEGGGKVPVFRVHFSDLNILISNWNISEPPDGLGILPDCQR